MGQSVGDSFRFSIFISHFWWCLGGCLEGVWRVTVGVWSVSGGCLEGVWRVSAGCLWGVWGVSVRCLGGVCEVFGGCLEGVWRGTSGNFEVLLGTLRYFRVI